jgi:hypothetical protein
VGAVSRGAYASGPLGGGGVGGARWRRRQGRGEGSTPCGIGGAQVRAMHAPASGERARGAGLGFGDAVSREGSFSKTQGSRVSAWDRGREWEAR